MKFSCLFDCVHCFCCCFAVIIFLMLYSRWLRRVTCVHIISKRLQTPARRSVDASTLSKKFAHLNNSILKNKSSACRSDAVLRKYYDTLPRSIRFRQLFNIKIEIAFILNLERPITATATASWPRLLYRWNLQGGGHLCHSDLCFVVKFVLHQINVLCDFCEHIQKIF